MRKALRPEDSYRRSSVAQRDLLPIISRINCCIKPSRAPFCRAEDLDPILPQESCQGAS